LEEYPVELDLALLRGNLLHRLNDISTPFDGGDIGLGKACFGDARSASEAVLALTGTVAETSPP